MTRTDPFDRLRHALSAVFRTSAPRGRESGGPSDGMPSDGTGELGLLEQDLDASFAEVEADLRVSRDILVLERLLLVLHRRVPVSAVRKSPVEGTGRVAFANGTSVIATTRPSGGLSQLAVSVLRGRVLLESARAVDDGVEMVFTLNDGRRFTAYAIGLDQED